VPIVDFYKYLGEAIAHPKETIQFMRDNSAMPDFRLESGFNEIVAKALQDNTKHSVNSPIIEKLQNIFSQVGARGDFISNVFGGYAFIQSQMKEGKTREEAVKNYEYETLRQQQSSLKSSKSEVQEYKDILNRLLFTFKSNAIAIGRKILDAKIQYMNNEISRQQYLKTITLYTLKNAMVITLISQLIAKIKIKDDDKKKRKNKKDDKDALPEFMLATLNNSILNLTFGLPIISELTDYTLNRIEKEFIPEHEIHQYQFAIKTVVVDDFAKAINGLAGNKKERNLLPALQFGIEAMTSIPIGNIIGYDPSGVSEDVREGLKVKKDAE
jgi:hypothetical protein